MMNYLNLLNQQRWSNVWQNLETISNNLEIYSSFLIDIRIIIMVEMSIVCEYMSFN